MRKFSLACFLIVFFLACLSVPASMAKEKTLTVVAPWKIKGMDIVESGFLFARMGCLEMLTTTDNSG